MPHAAYSRSHDQVLWTSASRRSDGPLWVAFHR